MQMSRQMTKKKTDQDNIKKNRKEIDKETAYSSLWFEMEPALSRICRSPWIDDVLDPDLR